MSVSPHCGIFGACHHSPAELVARVAASVGRSRVYVIVAGEPIPRRRVYVVTSVADLRTHAAILRRARATVVVCDALPLLMSVKGLTIIDADAVAQHKARWRPAPLNRRQLTAHLRRLQPTLVSIEFVQEDITTQLIANARLTGVLDKALTFSHRLQSKSDRLRVTEILFRYLTGKVKLKYLIDKLRPARIGTQTFKSYQDLIDSLKGGYGLALQKAVLQSVAVGWNPDRLIGIATKNGVDVFELRYLRTVALKTKGK